MKYTTVYVKQLENRKGKPWQARAKYKDEKGKWKETSKVLPEAKGKREAMRMAKEWMDVLNAQADVMPNADREKTFDEVFNEYLNHQLTTGIIERSTYSGSMSNYRNYIKPYLGNYMFASVDKVIINGWLTELYQKGFAQQTIHNAYSTAKKVYNYFFESGELLVHPFKGVKMPKKGDSKVTHLTKVQMDDVLGAVFDTYKPEDAMYAGILLAFYGGLRRGEICGLRWNDIDFYKKTITVRSAIGIGYKDGKYVAYSKNPKNKTSNRKFPMLPQLESALWERKEAINPKDNWYVVGDKEEFLHPHEYSRLFRNFVDAHGVVDAYGKRVVPHGLRHNFATVGIQAGMDIASLSLMMGHASRAMTLDTYGDANADALNVASVKLGETFNENTDYFKIEENEEE